MQPSHGAKKRGRREGWIWGEVWKVRAEGRGGVWLGRRGGGEGGWWFICISVSKHSSNEQSRTVSYRVSPLISLRAQLLSPPQRATGRHSPGYQPWLVSVYWNSFGWAAPITDSNCSFLCRSINPTAFPLFTSSVDLDWPDKDVAEATAFLHGTFVCVFVRPLGF